jgi:hypothetical protein
MGFNISGLAINKNYESEFNNLQKELGWNLEKQAEINFETASSNWKDDGICDAYFSEKGTLLFISMDMCTDSWPLKNDNTLTFALSETSMAFNINYCENGIEKRSIMEVEEQRMQDTGEKLEVEEKSTDTAEIIWNQMEVVIGKSFWSIEPGEKAVRYVFVKNDKITLETAKPEIHKSETVIESKHDSSAAATETKKWWQFWK